jgi:hypothetical protein
MNSALQKTLLVTAGPLLSVVAGAAVPQSNSAAVNECAQAVAARLGARLTAARAEALDPAEERTFLGVAQQELIVAARDPQGRIVAVMACTVDATDHVVSLRPASPDERVDASLNPY